MSWVSAIGYQSDQRYSYWSSIIGTPKIEERKQLFMEEQALDCRWNEAIRVLLQKGYKAHQIPIRQEVGNYFCWRDAFAKKAA